MRIIKANQKLSKDDSGSSNVIGAIISLSLLLMIGVLLIAEFQQQTDAQMADLNETDDADALAAYDNIKNSTWGAMNLMSMYPWILGAVAILGVVVLIGQRTS